MTGHVLFDRAVGRRYNAAPIRLGQAYLPRHAVRGTSTRRQSTAGARTSGPGANYERRPSTSWVTLFSGEGASRKYLTTNRLLQHETREVAGVHPLLIYGEHVESLPLVTTSFSSASAGESSLLINAAMNRKESVKNGCCIRASGRTTMCRPFWVAARTTRKLPWRPST